RIACLVRVGPNNTPQMCPSAEVTGQKYLSIEIPADVNTLHRESPELTARWREATRGAFSEAISSGYLVEDFYGSSRNNQALGVYLLLRGESLNFV
ncbi:MAG: hypothetical protein LC775_09220, partial [Acidobacteria bacterium]|nr:hypothetical protein [Acidobacteriota bacterium]